MRHLTAHTAETEQIGAVAADALTEIHTAIYGQAPPATRAWTDGDAILLVMRLPEGHGDDSEELPLPAIQRMVSAAVYRRTGETLRTAGTNLDADRGLVVLAFERLKARRSRRAVATGGPVPSAD